MSVDEELTKTDLREIYLFITGEATTEDEMKEQFCLRGWDAVEI